MITKKILPYLLEYTEIAKTAIRSMLGVPSVNNVVTDVKANGTSVLTGKVANIPLATTSADGLMSASDKVKLNSAVDDVQINGTSVVTDGVANIPIGGDNLGLVKVTPKYGVQATSDGTLATTAATSLRIKSGEDEFRPLTPYYQHESVFYGLAKASGDTTQSTSNNAVGAYTDEAKSAIQTMLDVPSKNDIPEVNGNDVQINGTSIVQNGVANVPVAGVNTLGVVKVSTGRGIEINGVNSLQLVGADNTAIKAQSDSRKPITPLFQHASTFYGLAKAAGDTTQSTSSNAVGTYTDSAKTAIKNMLGVIDGGGTISETITGTDPTITAQNNFRYMCGELYTLNFTPCVSGVCEVIFTSGATPTVLTLPDTVRMPTWWTGVEPNTTYEISIVDGVYGAVMSWS